MSHRTLSLLAALVATPALATTPTQGTTAELGATGPRGPNRWGVEVETIQPFLPTINIIRARATYTLWGSATGLRGDLLLGVYVRPGIEHDIVDRIHEYQLSVGYRQYVWRGLHAQVGLDGGLAWGRNTFDGRDYRTPTLFLDANVGYRFGFFEPGGFFEVKGGSAGFYIMPQFGALIGLGVADIGPRGGKPDWFLQGNLLIGASF